MRKTILSLLVSIPCVVAPAAATETPTLGAPASSGQSMVWQDYDQPGYRNAMQKYSAAAEYAITIRLQKLIADDQTPVSLIENYVERLVSICAYQNKFDAAEQYCNEALKFAERQKMDVACLARLHATRAKLFAKEGKLTQAEIEFNVASKILAAAAKQPPSEGEDRQPIAQEINRGLANIFTEQNRYPEAEQLFLKTMKPSTGAAPDLDELLQKCKAADADLDRYATVDEADVQRRDLVSFAKCLVGEEKFANAERSLLLAVKLDHPHDQTPSLAAEFNDLACVLVKETKYAEAEKCMDLAVSLCRRHERTDLQNWLENMAFVFNAQGKTEQAKAAHAEADKYRHSQIGESERQRAL